MQGLSIPEVGLADSIPDYTSWARCVKAQGYRHVFNNNALCFSCYDLSLQKHLYVIVGSHHLIISRYQIPILCTECSRMIQLFTPVHMCSLCLLGYIENIWEISTSGLSRSDDTSSLVLHVDGDRHF